MHNILLNIIEKKEDDLIEQKKKVSLEELKKKALQTSTKNNLFKDKIIFSNNVAIIAEIKLASPTIPSLGSESEITGRAKEYERFGASAISFITEPHYFKGKIEFISRLKRETTLPILQKDFVIDEYQIYQAKLVGADALLLIVRYLEPESLSAFVSLCLDLGIEPIVEINDEDDLRKAIDTKTNFIAVNARDLRDFKVDIVKACIVMKKIPKKFIRLGFSGINSSNEVKKYKEAEAKGVLVGTKLMRTRNIREFISSLRHSPSR